MSLAFSSLDIFVGDTLTLAWPPATLPVYCRLEDSRELTSASSYALGSAAIGLPNASIDSRAVVVHTALTVATVSPWNISSCTAPL
ncbi:hypothetical protein MTO96_020089 [Rhipicephalus appendiculatus]